MVHSLQLYDNNIATMKHRYITTNIYMNVQVITLTITFTSWFPSTPRPIILTSPGTLRVKSISTITQIGSYSSYTDRGVRVVGDHSIGEGS